MKHDVFRLTEDALKALENIAEESPDIYLNPSADFEALLRDRGIANYREPVRGVWSERPIELMAAESGAPNRADIQALDYHANLIGVTSDIATDVNFWAWVCHFRIHAYSISRWRIRANTNIANYVKAHWFSEDSGQEFRMRNTAARTWWIAHVARKAASGSGGAVDERQALEWYANHPTQWHLLMKDQFTRSPLMVAELTRVPLSRFNSCSSLLKPFSAFIPLASFIKTRVSSATISGDLVNWPFIIRCH